MPAFADLPFRLHRATVPSVSRLFLGSIVTSDNANKYSFKGQAHSIRFYDKALTPEQVASLDYDNVVTHLPAIYDASVSDYRLMDNRITVPTDRAELYDLRGRRDEVGSRLLAGVCLLKVESMTHKIVCR